jgi:hypothetical protein
VASIVSISIVRLASPWRHSITILFGELLRIGALSLDILLTLGVPGPALRSIPSPALDILLLSFKLSVSSWVVVALQREVPYIGFRASHRLRK